MGTAKVSAPFLCLLKLEANFLPVRSDADKREALRLF
jgi:hypothetical protein